MNRLQYRIALITLCSTLTACASLDQIVSAPEVSLTNVAIERLDIGEQTFLLSFDVNNPNPFPLPVSTISYAVKLDGQRFASGETTSDISVPASGATEFAISVELDLLSTAPQLLSIMRDGTRSEIPYSLEGRLGIGIPMTPPVTFRSDGAVLVKAGGF